MGFFNLNQSTVGPNILASDPTSFIGSQPSYHFGKSAGVPSRPKAAIAAILLRSSSLLPSLKSSVSGGPGETNNGDQPILFSRFKSALPELVTSTGKFIQAGVVQDMSFSPQKNDFVNILPRRTTYVLTDCSLRRTAQGTLQFSGDTHDGGTWTLSGLPLKAAQYDLALHYRSSEKEDFGL